MHPALERFHPLIADWFAARVGEPTPVQQLAWEPIAAGEHVLVTAPTGSGKTLTAFLWSLHQIIAGVWEPGAVRVLYISPLKALNNDIQRNLLGPLEELRERAAAEGLPPPAVRVMVRSGDTPPAERRRAVRQPPEIYITTPESLNLLLNANTAPAMFGGLRTVILDEIHAVAGGKRGTHLITAIERLTLHAGEFQRVALSATVRPLEVIAEFVGGRRLAYDGDTPVYTPRPVRVVAAPGAKRYECAVRAPGEAIDEPIDNTRWARLAAELKGVIARGRSTLIFTNSRRHCERVAHYLNEGQAQPIAYSHHGSLSRETREVVERRLKQGELKAIVATGSLELGIDIGHLDQVILVESPYSASAAIQRVGRAGHGVGEVSRAVLYPTGGRDAVDAAVICRAILEGDIEPLQPLRGPLDVLAQVLVSMCLEPRDIDRLFEFCGTMWPFAGLPREQFDRLLAMLAGRYAETRLRGLEPRLVIDRLANTVTCLSAARFLVNTSGGTIPDLGYFRMRVEGSQSVVGELDEEFVWERRVGDVFTFGTQSWQIERVTDSDVFVSHAGGRPTLPFWKGEPIDRDWHFAERVGAFLEQADAHLDEVRFEATLRRDYRLDASCIDELVGYLHRQRGVTASRLPHRHHLLAEWLEAPNDDAEAYQVVLHTLWGGRVNRPFALALAGAWEERFRSRVEAHIHNDGVALMLPFRLPVGELLALLDPDRIELLLRARLEETGFFGARFRENAARALLLPRGGPGQRMPLWLNRQRSRRLLDAVGRYDDFPMLLETWRTCLHDCFDLPAVRMLLREVAAGHIALSECETVSPSPFAERLAWRQVNYMMYLDDTPAARGTSLSESILREAVFDADLRPEIEPALVSALEAKLQRTHPGYAPRDALELLDLLQERIAVPAEQWQALLEAIARDGGDPESLLAELADRRRQVRLPGAAVDVVVATESLPRLAACLGFDAEPDLPAWRPPEDSDPLADLIAGWLQFHGPLDPARLAPVFGLDPGALTTALDNLVDQQRLVRDRLTRGATTTEICDAENLERLLAAVRRGAQPDFEPQPLDLLPLHIARRHGLTERATGIAGLQDALTPLLGLPAAAELWETEILPARLVHYTPDDLDDLVRRSGLLWLGADAGKILFCFDDQRELLADAEPDAAAACPVLLPETGRYRVQDLALRAGSAGGVQEALWQAAWDGVATADAFAPVRDGVATRFRAGRSEPATAHRGRSPARWQRQPAEPCWYRLRRIEPPADALEALELDRERVRLVAERYGLVCRDLCGRELPALRWGRLFRACRIMELAGELLAGAFYAGLPGIQFAPPESLAAWRRRTDDEAVWWLCAADPASLCGLKLPGLEDLPDRRAATHLVYHGRRPVLISLRSGRTLEFRVPPEHPHLGDYAAILGEQQERAVRARRGIVIERINDLPATTSPYLAPLRERFHVTVDPLEIRLWRRL